MKACVDIGGTKVAVSLADGRRLAFKRTEPTVKSGAPDALARQVIRMVRAATAEAGVPHVEAVGVAACGPFVLDAGQIALAAPNLCGGIAGPLRGLDNDWTCAALEGPLREVFAQVRIENDAVAALEAERRWGALRGIAHCAYITWSTGIGVGLCVDDRVLHGKHGNAGHAGHMYTDAAETLCGCGNRGDVESLVAGSAIARRWAVDAARLFSQEPTAAQELGRVMARMVHNLVVTLDLQRIALGGSVFWHQQALLLPLLRQQLGQGTRALCETVELVPAGLGMAVGDLAALALVSD